MAFRIPGCKAVRIEIHRHDFALTALQQDLFEALQLFRRFFRSCRTSEIQLNHFGTIAGSGVCDAHFDCDLLVPCALQLQIAIAERCIGKAITEREKRLLIFGVVVSIANQNTFRMTVMPSPG
jgi:hypothetical protein